MPSRLDSGGISRQDTRGGASSQMPDVLICSSEDLTPALEGTALWREAFARHYAGTLEEARRALATAKPTLVLVERDLPWATDIVKAMRRDAATRRCPLAILARGDFEPRELELLEAGANAVFRLPPGEDWDKRLARLLQVTVRRDARVAIHLQLEATLGEARQPFTATTLNLSETGMLIEAGVKLDPGQELDFALQLPGVAGLISGRARVARFDGRYAYGLEFTDLAGEFLDRLREFLPAPRTDP